MSTKIKLTFLFTISLFLGFTSSGLALTDAQFKQVLEKCNQGVLSKDLCKEILGAPQKSSKGSTAPEGQHRFSGVWWVQQLVAMGGGMNAPFINFWKVEVLGGNLHVTECQDIQDLDQPDFPSNGDCRAYDGAITSYKYPNLMFTKGEHRLDESVYNVRFQDERTIEGKWGVYVRDLFSGKRKLEGNARIIMERRQ